MEFSLISYDEHALSRGSSSKACAYVGIQAKDSDKVAWGVGIQNDIIEASAYALISAINKELQNHDLK